MSFKLYIDSEGVPYSDYGNYNGIDIGRQRSVLAVAERGLWYWNNFFREGKDEVCLSYDWSRWPHDSQQYCPQDSVAAKRMIINCAEWLVDNIQPCQGFSIWTYPYPFSYNTAPGWRSAQTQTVAMQFLLRANELTGEYKYIASINELLAAFRVAISDGGLSTVTESGNLWFEKIADVNNLQPKILNGMLFAIIGLDEIGKKWEITEANDLANIGMLAAIEYLPRFDLGDWSAYDIFGKRASKHYHAVHVRQLNILSSCMQHRQFSLYHKKFLNYSKLARKNKRIITAEIESGFVQSSENAISEKEKVPEKAPSFISLKNKYAILTIDTEALPKRAVTDHVQRLIWGQHDKGVAGIREMSLISNEVGAKLTFFVDACGAYQQLEQVAQVVQWLNAAGHDVQLHTHPEYLPEHFWTEHGYSYKPRFLNQYGLDKALFTIQYFGRFISGLTGKPIIAFRAGSFRWNADTLRALKLAGIPLSFNNSMNAFLAGQCTYGEPTNLPYQWSNEVVEVPVTERKFFPLFGKEWWGRLQFPVGNWFGSPPWRVLNPYISGKNSSLLVMLLHSWSLLYWDKNGYAEYRNDKRIEDFRKLMCRLSKDYEIITASDFHALSCHGKIQPTHLVDIGAAEMKPVVMKTMKYKRKSF